MQQTTRDFWNDRYREKTGETSGKPGLFLSQFAGPLVPGRGDTVAETLRSQRSRNRC